MINCKTIRKSLSKKTTALVLAVICSMALSDVTTIKASAAINTSSTQEVKWDQTVFGASTSKENNKIEDFSKYEALLWNPPLRKPLPQPYPLLSASDCL